MQHKKLIKVKFKFEKKNYYNILYFNFVLVTTASSPLVEADSIVNQIKKEQRSLHFARRQATPNRQILKSSATTARDVTYTQFAVIDDDNLSAMQQVTRGGGGTFNLIILFKLFMPSYIKNVIIK